MKENTSQEKKTARRGRIAGQNMKKDSSTTLLFKTSNENFAELFNRTMSDFDQLRPEDLSEEDIKEAAYLRITKADGGTALVQYRDVVKSARNGRIFAILGIEQQSEVDYAMPFRVLELDFVNYARQVQIIRERHEREWRDEKGNMHIPGRVSTGEYLGRFIAANPGHFSNVSKTAVNALAELTHSPQLQGILTPQYRTKKGGFNVCKGLDGMIQEGIQKGIQKGMKKGMEKGILTGKKEMAVSLSAMGMSVEEIAMAAKVSEGVVRSWLSGNAG